MVVVVVVVVVVSMKFEDMDVYKNGMEIIKRVYMIDFPADEKFMLRSQLVRSSQSILLNISEGQAYTNKQKIHFYRIALGSCYECLACINIYNENIKMTDNVLYEMINRQCALIKGMIRSAMNKDNYDFNDHNDNDNDNHNVYE